MADNSQTALAGFLAISHLFDSLIRALKARDPALAEAWAIEAVTSAKTRLDAPRRAPHEEAFYQGVQDLVRQMVQATMGEPGQRSEPPR